MRTRRAWGAYLVLGVAATAAYFSLNLTPLSQNIVYDAIGLSAVVAIVLGIKTHRPGASAAWYLIAAGQLLFVAGDVLWVVFEFALHIDPFPSIADVFYLGGYPLLAAGVLKLVRVHRGGGDRGALIDGSIMAIGAGLVAWVFLIDPYVDDHTLSGLELAISVAYPLADILILGVAIRLAEGDTWGAPVYRFLMASLVGLLVADVVYGFQALGSGYEDGDLVEAGWLLAYVLVGAGALHPSVRTISEAKPFTSEPRRPPLAALAGAAALAPIALQLQAQRGVEAPDVLVFSIGSAAIFLLVVTRLSGMVREVDSKVKTLNRQGNTLRTALHGLRRLEGERKLLLERVLAATEEERIRVAAHLHDGPIQQLTGLGYGLERAKLRFERGDANGGTTLLETTQKELSEEIEGLRAIMTSLRPPALDEHGLEGALRDQVSSFGERTGTECTVATTVRRRLDPELETILYRVTQEALANISKHADASRVSVEVEEHDGVVELAVSDDGRGFDAGAWPAGALDGHFGLLAMREQVQIARGSFEVTSQPGAGTVVRATLPTVTL